MYIHHTGLREALADRGRDTQVEYKDRDEVEKRGKQYGLPGLEHPGRDHGRDGVGGIVKAIHEVEHQCQRHQQQHHSYRHLRGCHMAAAQEFSRTMPSTILATSSHLSVMVSSNS